MPRQNIRSRVLVLALAAILPALIPNPGHASAVKLRVVTTVFPLAEFARTIIGDRGEVSQILPPGADVHTWLPRVSDIRKIETADLLISVGQGLEPWLESLLKGAKTAHLLRIQASEGLSLIRTEEEAPGGADHDHDHGEFDPHVWLDFFQDELIVDSIARTMTRLDPAGSGIFEENAKALRNRLRALDEAYRTTLRNCRGRKILIGGHAAFSYLARRYGLTQIALYGASPDAAPTPRETAAAIDRAQTESLITVFFEPGVGDKMARLIAAEIGADVRILQPGHNLSPEQTARRTSFFKLMEENLENLKHGLGCR
jgi:zinc transport system substrate-binding protein